ncbi:MAG TPA: Gldg family protein, partial [Alphaproteobacteria bacterium]|nr:Gldg family protein [Alphaproteobacteria bacterium]
MNIASELLNAALLAAMLAALAVLFMAGLRLPMPRAPRRRTLLRAGLVAAAAILTLLANLAAYRNDVHIDLTREEAFTPSPEAERVVRSLTRDVELTYFYQRNNPAAVATRTMVELMGRLNPHLRVRTIDPDQNPATASKLGVRIYNAALITSGDRRIEVITTDDRDIARGILRAARSTEKTICFATGHGEYDIDNFEFHTHFEGTHSHSHDSSGLAVVQMQMHGIGRLRRALDQLGLNSRKVVLATGKAVPADCAALVDANPRTPFGPREPQ